jgi:hypothetical protein
MPRVLRTRLPGELAADADGSGRPGARADGVRGRMARGTRPHGRICDLRAHEAVEDRGKWRIISRRLKNAAPVSPGPYRTACRGGGSGRFAASR